MRLQSVPYAELHCHSNFSFLDGASDPAELVTEASRLELSALALTDHDGLYGVVRFAEAARRCDLPTVFGSELSLEAAGARTGQPDPVATHLVVLADGADGYARLATAITEAQMTGEKGHPRLSLDRLAALAGPRPGTLGGCWVILTGCRKGPVNKALETDGPTAARRALDQLVDRFGRDQVVVELWDHGHPLDGERNDALTRLAASVGVTAAATNNVHYHRPSRRRLATVMAAARARRSLDELDGWLPAAAGAYLRSGAEQARRFSRWPGVVEAAAELGRRCAFDLQLIAPALPPFRCPEGLDEMAYLRQLATAGALDRYGPREAERVPGAWRQIDRELTMIGQLGFCGYFLIVWDVVEFCRRSGIFCQGRGSAANSTICYALGITNVDAVGLGLLFERFMSPERDGPPDIDVDIESGRREEVIQYVYKRYDRRHTAQVANVITYRSRSAVRDVSRALGYAQGQQDAFARAVEHRLTPGRNSVLPLPADVAALTNELCGTPRHLGIHSGGMVICDRPVSEVCPVEWARMKDRSVLQWDKDDCAAVGLVKFDLLGLGILSALHGAIDLVAEYEGIRVDLARLPQEEAVYDMVCVADTIGVFQIESRAQMAALPRSKPRCFYDLVVQVALIRPGPIQGGSVHPYIRRRNGREPVTYLHPLCERALAKTLGVPLFQEQLMQLAIDVAGFTPVESDHLRRIISSKHSREGIETLWERFEVGATSRGVSATVVKRIWEQIVAFADYGFPESHSVSFAYLVYASCWIKHHYPAAFCTALINAQPMGFYAPHTLVQDARRHGVEVHTPDVQQSAVVATLEPDRPTGLEAGPTIRLGLRSVRGVGEDLAEAIVAGRPWRSIEDFQDRLNPGRAVLEALATAGAFGCFGVDRRSALWSAGALATLRSDRLPGTATGVKAPALPPMSAPEMAWADLWSTGISPDGHPTRFLRQYLATEGVLTAKELCVIADGQRVKVAGVVTHRQRPSTAGGTTFINLEDETGLVSVVVSKGCWARFREVATSALGLIVGGRLERATDGERVLNVVAERLEHLSGIAEVGSRDFR